MTTTRAALVDAAKDLNKVLGLNPEIDVKQGAGQLRDLVREAAQLLQPTDEIGEATRAVVADLTGVGGAQTGAEVEGAEEGEVKTVPKKATSKGSKAAKGKTTGDGKAKTPGRTPAIGKFSPVRRGSHYAKILDAVLSGLATTIADAASAAEIDRDKALAVLKRARVTNGIDFELGDDGSLSVLLPRGVDAEGVWHKPKESQGGSGDRKKYTDDDVITLRVDKNPKQAGSAAHARFEHYRSGMTVGEFLAAGGSRADLSWDTGKEFISIGS